MEMEQILAGISEVADEFAKERTERQLRRELAPEDFKRLAEAGFLAAAVPVELGGAWRSMPESTRAISDMLRTIAHADSSVALVASMHPSVLSFWLATPHAPEPHDEAWSEQRRFVFDTALRGEWWGTITSEPGSGGDITRTAAIARQNEDLSYGITGRKQFGTGLGIASYMITNAVPADELDADWFYMDMHNSPWQGSNHVRMVAPWDGHGMIASQSHALHFEDYPATRFAWPGNLRKILVAPSATILCGFAAVTVGIVEIAMETAHRHLATRHASLRSFERIEWTRAEMEAWQIRQAYEAMLRAVETDTAARRTALMGKTVIAELAESAMSRLCKVLGGGTYARYAPYGFWLEDVRALGFLRPPWGLAYESLFESGWG